MARSGAGPAKDEGGNLEGARKRDEVNQDRRYAHRTRKTS